MNGWDVRPTLDRANANRRPLAQAAGSFVAGSPLPQALIQCRQRLTYELRLGKLVIPCRGQHRSLWQTTRRWPSPRRPLHRPRPPIRTDRGLAATPHSEPDLTPRHIIAYRAACMYAPASQGTSTPHLKWLRLPRSKMALNSRSVPRGELLSRTGHALGAAGEESPGTGGVIRFPARFDLLYASARRRSRPWGEGVVGRRTALEGPRWERIVVEPMARLKLVGQRTAKARIATGGWLGRQGHYRSSSPSGLPADQQSRDRSLQTQNPRPGLLWESSPASRSWGARPLAPVRMGPP